MLMDLLSKRTVTTITEEEEAPEHGRYVTMDA